MLHKRLSKVARLTLLAIFAAIMSACSVNPYTQPPPMAKVPVSAEQAAQIQARLPADADRSQMDFQYDLARMGKYLAQDGTLKSLPEAVVAPVVAPQPAVVTSRKPIRKSTPRAQRPAKVEEAMVLDSLPAPIDITQGARR